MTKKQHYMTRDERSQLEVLLKAKVQVSRIARQLGFCRQTIYNEMKRGAYVHTCDYWDEKRYSADKAQQLHDYNQTAKGRPLKIGNDRAYAMFLEEQWKHDRMIRRWFPKGTDFSRVPKKEIAEFQDWLYHYPRKVLGWKSPAELAL